MKKIISLLYIFAVFVFVFAGCKKSPAYEDELVFVEGGKFTMGTDEYKCNYQCNAHELEVSSFYISSMEVTQGEYEEIMGSNPSFYQGEARGKRAVNDEIQTKRPIEKITWYEAIMYCNKLSIAKGLNPVYTKVVDGKDESNVELWGDIPEKANKEWNSIKWNRKADGYRLLTEAEWEYAAKGGKQTQNFSGAGFDVYSDDDNNYAWGDWNAQKLTHQVGLKCANELGLYDMSGNVWEWVWDWFGEKYYKTEGAVVKDTAGPETADFRCVRGGSWEDDTLGLAVFTRGSSSPHLPSRRVGFRIGRNIN